MSYILDKCHSFDKLSNSWKHNIKYLYSLDNNKSILFITSDDRVYGFGQNFAGCLGLGDNRRAKEPQLISELCDQNVNKFFNGWNFVLALNSADAVFGWGKNEMGQLARGYRCKDYEFLRPLKVQFEANIAIKEISCGYYHCLALTYDGVVYGWGSNTAGQVGCRTALTANKCLNKPKKLKNISNESIYSVYCYAFSSFAITNKGHVFSWGKNESSVLGHEKQGNKCWNVVYSPKLIPIENIHAICCSNSITYYLKTNGFVYYFADNKQLKSIANEDKTRICDIKTNCNKMIAFNGENVYYFNEINFVKTNYKCFADYCMTEFGRTYKTICIDNNNNDSHYHIISTKGSGGFGTVYEIRDKNDGKHYALKIINTAKFDKIDEMNLKKEITLLQSITSEHIVQYISHWFEDNANMVYIQMELCSTSLRHVLNDKRRAFERNDQGDNGMDITEYYISCQILLEILQCVQYLHDLKPPVIHRDLKPENILISYDNTNGKFIKLCDLGAAVVQRSLSMTLTSYVGTGHYMAPEVVLVHQPGQLNYTCKADVYSVGKIAEELFEINIHSTDRFETNDPIVRTKASHLEDIISSIIINKLSSRPTCADVLRRRSEWAVNRHRVKASKEFDFVVNKLKDNKKNIFFYKYLTSRIQRCGQ